MPNALKIKKIDPKIPSWWLFNELREKGVDYIASFSGELWTDHNLHDPGITMLEVLCYALSDLGYRTKLDVEDIFAIANGEAENNFFTPEQILTCNPLTILDYRKMLVDITGIRNAWLVPADEQEVRLYINCEKGLQFSPTKQDTEHHELILNGLYKVYLDIDPLLGTFDTSKCDLKTKSIDKVLKTVKTRLQQHRNLSEDFLDIIVLQDEQIGLCSDIELSPNANPDEVLAAIYEVVEAFLSPRLNFYSLKERINAGKSLEEIFEGRPYTPAYGDTNKKFSHGFIDNEELEASALRERLLASDFYRVIMDIPGIRAIKSLYLSNFKDGISRTDGELWELELSKNHRPIFSPELSTFNFHKGVLRISANSQKVVNRFKKRLSDIQKNKFAAADLNLRVPYGNHRSDLSDYLSIQHEFPVVYGIGKGHLSNESPEERKVQALQLKGYLSFFDQLLAGYLSQLSNVRKLFSWEIEGQTYFQQTVESIPLAEKIFLSHKNAANASNLNEGEVIALPLQPFKHPTERDMAITQLLELFNNFSSKDKDNNDDNIVQTRETSDGYFHFVIIGNNTNPILISKKQYPSKAEALSASEVLFFQGTLPQTYEEINWSELQEYSFSFVYKPVNYKDYLQKIAETESNYFERKDKFLNHLLARFDEQFTEYVLLMYALNQGVPDPRNIIEDKARFLKNYPDISRNRGRGFDYTDKNNLWNSEKNISGLEKRVAGLMGLDNWQRRNLNNFEVVLREQAQCLCIKDHRGIILFETTNCYKTEEEIDAAEIILESLLCNPKAYEPFGCTTESVFGFQLLGDDGKVFANYQRTYGSEEARNNMLDCTQSYFCEPKGLMLKIVAEEEGFYFLLLNANEESVYLKSKQAYESEQEACYAWLDFIKLAQNKDNYFAIQGNYDGGQYSFGVFEPPKKNAKKVEIAYHPQGYISKTVRTKKKNEVSTYAGNRKIEYEICQLPDLFSWSLVDENQETLLKSVHQFKTIEQSFAAWHQFKNEGLIPENYHNEITADGKFSFSISKKELILVRSLEFLSEEERDTAKDKTQDLIFRECLQEKDKTTNLNTQTVKGQFIFILYGADKLQALIGVEQFDSKKKAECAYFHFLKKAGLATFYRDKVQGGTCLYSFEIVEHSKVLAYHPRFYIQSEKDTIQTGLINYISSKRIPFDVKSLPGFYHFEIWWENCAGHCEPLLIEEGAQHTSQIQAETAAANFIENSILSWDTIDEHPNYSFSTEANNIIAKHPVNYETSIKRDKVLNDAKLYFEYYYKLNNGEIALIETKPKWDICGQPCREEDEDEFCLLSGFRLSKANQPIAYHPIVFDNRDDQNLSIQKLLKKAQCGLLPYPSLCLQGSKITVKSGTKHYFELWESNTPKLLWRSSTAYNSATEAAEQFHYNWLNIIELSSENDNFKLPDEECPFLSLWNDNKRIAFLPITINSETEALDIQHEWWKIARTFPIYKAKDGYHFRLRNELGTETLWESSQVFPSFSEAFQAFNHFYKLLRHTSNYRWKNNKKACIFQIEISETLLEGSRTYADVFTMSNSARYGTAFESADAAQNEINLIQSNYSSPISTQEINEDHLVPDPKTGLFNYQFITNINDSADEDSQWTSQISYTAHRLAFQALREFQLNLSQIENYSIIEEVVDDVSAFHIELRNFRLENEGFNLNYQKDTRYAACPAIFQNDEFQVKDKSILVTEDCNDFGKEDTCIQTFAPAAWDEGLQSFLIHAINEDNFYSFVDYADNCHRSFRVVTDKYRLARNVREFHLPAHQAQFKDWLYGYSSCEKCPDSELPVPKFCRRNGLYHYYIENGDWLSFQGYETKKLATKAFNTQLLDFYAYAQELDFYDLTKVSAPVDGWQVQLLDENGAILALHLNVFQTAEEWNAAILELILGARKFPYFKYEGKYGFQCFALENAPVFEPRERTACDPPLLEEPCTIPCEYAAELINVDVPGEVIWESIVEYDTQEEVICAYNAFLGLLRDKNNYQSIHLQDCNLFGLEITHPNQVLATHPQSYASQTALNEAIKKTQACINAEGFHLVEHILLRPKKGVSHHITVQFMSTVELDCPDENGNPIFNEQPYLILQTGFDDSETALAHKNTFIELLIKYLNEGIDKAGLNQNLAKNSAIVFENISLFIETLYNAINDAQVDLTLEHIEFPEGFWDKLIFCFNKSSDETPDNLIETTCPCCEDKVALPVEETSDEACEDAKDLLKKEPNNIAGFINADGTIGINQGFDANDLRFITDFKDTKYYIPGADPYSFWISIILPYWPKRFQNSNFRHFFEDTLRRETPAHIGIKICWLDPLQMQVFEQHFQSWLEAFSGNENCNLQDAQCDLIETLFGKDGISNVYPPARLQKASCVPGSNDPGAVLLDFTQLG